MSFALRRQKIIVLCRCNRKQWEMGFFFFSLLLLPEVSEVGWVFFSATPHW